MVSQVLTVCTANICRSPVAEAVLRAGLPGLTVRSAGLYALVGRGIDPEIADTARAQGIALHDHAARQFDDTIGREADVIIVMETHHRQDIGQRWPQFLGKTFLLGHFDNARQIPDPYKQTAGMQHHSVELIAQCSRTWIHQLEQMTR